MSATVVTACEGGVLTLTMNRPEKLNALTSELLGALRDRFAAAAEDPAVRVVVLRGAGRAFCAGQDLSESAVGDDLGAHVERYYKPLVLAMRALPKPIVAEVHGVAAGAGANLAFACDLVFAARSATFIESFARIGLVADTGGTWMLPRLVGHARAMGLALLCTPLTAEQAHAWGAIWEVADDAALADRVADVARALAHAPTQALAAAKHAIEAGWTNSIQAQLDVEGALQRALGRTDDFHEGVAAFGEKRPPVFRGR